MFVLSRLNDEKNIDDYNDESHVLVLCSLLKISNSDLLPYLETLIDDYFLAVELNMFDNLSLRSMCRIILTMSESIYRWYPIDNNNDLVDLTNQNEFICIDLKKMAQKRKKNDSIKPFKDIIQEIDKSLMNKKPMKLVDNDNDNDENHLNKV